MMVNPGSLNKPGDLLLGYVKTDSLFWLRQGIMTTARMGTVRVQPANRSFVN